MGHRHGRLDVCPPRRALALQAPRALGTTGVLPPGAPEPPRTVVSRLAPARSLALRSPAASACLSRRALRGQTPAVAFVSSAARALARPPRIAPRPPVRRLPGPSGAAAALARRLGGRAGKRSFLSAPEAESPRSRHRWV